MRDAQTVIGIIVPIKYRLPRFTWTRRSPLCTHHRLLYDHVAIILSRDLSYRKAEHDSSIRIHRRKIICGISSMRPSSQDSLLLSILLRFPEFEEERKIGGETDGSLKEINLSRWSLIVIASSRFDFCQAKESQSLFTMTSPKMNLRFWIWSRHSIVSSRFRWSLPTLKLRQNNISISDENTSWIHPINKFPLAGALENARSE